MKRHLPANNPLNKISITSSGLITPHASPRGIHDGGRRGANHSIRDRPIEIVRDAAPRRRNDRPPRAFLSPFASVYWAGTQHNAAIMRGSDCRRERVGRRERESDAARRAVRVGGPVGRAGWSLRFHTPANKESQKCLGDLFFRGEKKTFHNLITHREQRVIIFLE